MDCFATLAMTGLGLTLPWSFQCTLISSRASRRAAAVVLRGRPRDQAFERGGGRHVEPSWRFQFPQRSLDTKPAEPYGAQPIERDLVPHRRGRDERHAKSRGDQLLAR